MRNVGVTTSKGKRPSLPDISAFLGTAAEAATEDRPSRETRRLVDLGYSPETASALALSVLGRDIIDRRDTQKAGSDE